MSPHRILIVEDEPDIAGALAEHLLLEGFAVDVAPDGESALAMAASRTPSLVVLDLMLPGIPGETVLRSLRGDGYLGPVLILSAKQGEADKVHGFRLGADDFVTKPFGLLELLARVHALLRRASTAVAGPESSRTTRIAFGPYVFDLSGHQVLLDGHEIALRPRERELLFALLDRPGQTVSRPRLLRQVWGYADGVDSRTVDWHVAELRRKLEDGTHGATLIHTVRKVGYRLELEASVSAAATG
jgi:DNA-binding response OmpR family regulator